MARLPLSVFSSQPQPLTIHHGPRTTSPTLFHKMNPHFVTSDSRLLDNVATIHGRMGTKPRILFRKTWDPFRVTKCKPLAGHNLRLRTPDFCRQNSKISEPGQLLQIRLAGQRTKPTYSTNYGQQTTNHTQWATIWQRTARETRPKLPGIDTRQANKSIPEWIRTTNLRLRRPTLYPVELRGRA